MSKNRTKEQYKSIAWHKRQHAPSEELRSFSRGERSTTDRLREERRLSHQAASALFYNPAAQKRTSTKIEKHNTNPETEKSHVLNRVTHVFSNTQQRNMVFHSWKLESPAAFRLLLLKVETLLSLTAVWSFSPGNETPPLAQS